MGGGLFFGQLILRCEGWLATALLPFEPWHQVACLLRIGCVETRLDPAVLNRMRTVFDLFEAAEAMMRTNLRRRYPDETEEQIDRRFLRWLSKADESSEPIPGTTLRPAAVPR